MNFANWVEAQKELATSVEAYLSILDTTEAGAFVDQVEVARLRTALRDLRLIEERHNLLNHLYAAQIEVEPDQDPRVLEIARLEYWARSTRRGVMGHIIALFPFSEGRFGDPITGPDLEKLLNSAASQL